MDPVTVHTTISRPREEIFDYLADVANHPEFCDHFLVLWRLTREDSYGEGAGARFRVKARFNRFAFGDITLAELDRPRLILARGRGGRFNRIRTVMTWELEPGGPGATRVEFTIETEPKLLSDRIMEIVLLTRWTTRRHWAKALRRLRAILEHGEQRGRRATISGGPRKPATGTPLRWAEH